MSDYNYNDFHDKLVSFSFPSAPTFISSIINNIHRASAVIRATDDVERKHGNLLIPRERRESRWESRGKYVKLC